MRHKSRRSIIWGKLYLHNSRRDVVVIGNQLYFVSAKNGISTVIYGLLARSILITLVMVTINRRWSRLNGSGLWNVNSLQTLRER